MDADASISQLASQAAALVVVMVGYMSSRIKRKRSEEEPTMYGPRLEADEHRQKNLQVIYNSTDSECLAMFRMTRAPFYQLCKLFRQRGLLQDTLNSSVEEQVSMFLHVVGHNQRFRVVHQSFRRSIETVSRHFHQVLYAVGELRGEMIRPPSTDSHPKILGSQR